MSDGGEKNENIIARHVSQMGLYRC